MKKIHIHPFVFGIILTLISLGATQISPELNSTCLVQEEFFARTQGLRANIFRDCLVILGCNGRYQRYCMRKNFTYFEGRQNKIKFKEFRTLNLCSDTDGQIYSQRFLSIVKFGISKEGETEKIEFFDENDELMVVLILKQWSKIQRIRRITLQGRYTLYLPPVLVYFPEAGRLEIGGCNNISGSYSLSNNGEIRFNNVIRHSQCDNDYENFVADAISNSIRFTFTNQTQCKFQLSQNQGRQKQLNVVVEPVPSFTGNYVFVILTMSESRIQVMYEESPTFLKLKLRGCNMIYFTFSKDEDKKLTLVNQKVTEMGNECDTALDDKYIGLLREVASYSFNPESEDFVLSNKIGLVTLVGKHIKTQSKLDDEGFVINMPDQNEELFN